MNEWVYDLDSPWYNDVLVMAFWFVVVLIYVFIVKVFL